MSEYPHTYQTPTGAIFRIRIESDEEAMSPRDATNISIITMVDNVISPDENYVPDWQHPRIPSEWVANGRVDMRRFGRYVNLFDTDIIAMVGIQLVNDWRPTLRLVPFDHDWQAADEYDGICTITRKSWGDCFGFEAPHSPDKLIEYMQQDINAYNAWARGDYRMYVIELAVQWTRADTGDTRTEWEYYESVGGFESHNAALADAIELLPDGSEPVTAMAAAMIAKETDNA